MAIVVNTNVQSIQVQNNLTRVTDKMNTAMERMTTGAKINHAADDAAGLVISKGIEVQTRGSQVAKNNAQTGVNLLQTAEGNLAVMQDNFMRIRDLTLQAMNGGQTDEQLVAMEEEATARLAEIDRVATGAKYNTFDLFGGTDRTKSGDDTAVTLQIGTGSNSAVDTVTISGVFDDAHVSTLTGTAGFASKFSGFTSQADGLSNMQTQLDALDAAITELSSRRGTIGSTSNRLSSAIEQLDTQYENLTAANSRIKDADIATESSNYIQNQILQQASASLLTQANQQPSIALSLI